MLTGKFEATKLRIAIDAIPKDVERAYSDTLDEIGRILLASVKQKALVDTGKYARSWKIGRKTSRSISVTSPETLLFVILEFTGRRPGIIYPKRGSHLKFKIGDKTIYARYVQHPGFPPFPHIRPALRQTVAQIPAIIQKNFGSMKIFAGRASSGYIPKPVGAAGTPKPAARPKNYKLSVRRTVTRKTGKKRLSRRRTQRAKIDR